MTTPYDPPGGGVSNPVTIPEGGTGATTAAAAVTNLGVAYYLDSYTGTDDQKMASALSALFAASPAGGIIQLSNRAHTFVNQWSTTYAAGVATAVKIQGGGVAFNGAWGSPSAATTATFTYSGGGAACADFQHIGTIEITGIQFIQANNGVPFFQTTNAAPNLHDLVFSGGGSFTGCVTDAIILGGTGNSTGAGDTAKFNGYQGSIDRIFFDGIRTGVFVRGHCNGTYIGHLTFSASCGCISTTAQGAVTILGTAGTALSVGGYCGHTVVEASNYTYGIYLDYAIGWTLEDNNFYDGPTVIGIYFNSNSAYGNTVILGYCSGTPLNLGYSHVNNIISNGTSRTDFIASLDAPTLSAYGITGTGGSSRYVGSTASGPPTSGTFQGGDWVVDLTAAIWVCTTAGSPGTWTNAVTSTASVISPPGMPSGESLTINTGTGGSYFPIIAFATQFKSYQSGNTVYAAISHAHGSLVLGGGTPPTSAGTIATVAPPSSSTIQTALGNLVLGTAWQNSLSYDVYLTVYLAITANTSLVVLDGVGTTTTPTQTTIITGTTAMGIVPIKARVPAGQYRLLSVTGTGADAIVGQYLESS